MTGASPVGRLLLVCLAAVAMTCSDGPGTGGGSPPVSSTPTATPDGSVGGSRTGILPRDALTACRAEGVPAVRRAVTTTEGYLAARDGDAGSEEVARLRGLSLGRANAAALAFGRCARDLERGGDRDGAERTASAARHVAERARALARAVDEDRDVATAAEALTGALAEWDAATGGAHQQRPGPAPLRTSDP